MEDASSRAAGRSGHRRLPNAQLQRRVYVSCVCGDVPGSAEDDTAWHRGTLHVRQGHFRGGLSNGAPSQRAGRSPSRSIPQSESCHKRAGPASGTSERFPGPAPPVVKHVDCASSFCCKRRSSRRPFLRFWAIRAVQCSAPQRCLFSMHSAPATSTRNDQNKCLDHVSLMILST